MEILIKVYYNILIVSCWLEESTVNKQHLNLFFQCKKECSAQA